MPKIEIITTSGAVIHVDDEIAAQTSMLPTVIAAFGGEVFRAELSVPAEPSA